MPNTEVKEIKYVSPEKLGYYHGKMTSFVEAKDTALKNELEGKISEVSQAVANEEIRAKASEATNLAAAQAAQAKGEEALAHSTGLAAKVGTVPTDKTVMGIIDEIIEGAYDDTEVRGLISGLAESKADKEQVAKDIAAAVKVEEEARIAAVAGVQGAVDGLTQTHATDKSELEGKIALKADQTALDAVSGVANAAATKAEFDAAVEALEAEDERIAGLVSAEAERAANVEADHKARIEKMEAFFVGAAEDEGEGESLKNALDTLVEIQTYIDNDGAAADEMVKGIADNKKLIEDHMATDHDFAAADATLKAELEGKIDAKADASVVTAMDEAYKAADADILEQIDSLGDEVGTKVSQEDFGDLLDRVSEAEGKISASEEAIGELQALAGEGGTLEGMIEEVQRVAEEKIRELEEGQVATNKQNLEALEEEVSTKASQEEVTEISGKVEALEGSLEELQTEFDEQIGNHTHSWNDLTDKPFGYEQSQTGGNTIEWDGNTEGLEQYEFGGATYYKISDNVISLSDLTDGFSYTMMLNDNIQQNSMNYSVLSLSFSPNGNYFSRGVLAFIADKEEQGFPSTGIWVCDGMDGSTYLAFRSLTIPNYTSFPSLSVKTLDEKYIPSSIARTSVVDELSSDYEAYKESNNEAVAGIQEDVVDHEGRIAALEAVDYVEIQESYIDSLFATN